MIILIFLLATDIFAHESCLKPLVAISWPSICEHDEQVIIEDLPISILNWGSQGRGGRPWYYKNPSCNNFYITIMKNITLYEPDIKLSPHDLFHGHIINYNKNSRALLFHAKEYPADVEKIKNYYQNPEEKFLSTDSSFNNRNYIYLTSDTSFANKNILYLVDNKAYCQRWFEPLGLNYLSEELLAENLPEAKLWGDINMFLVNNIQNILYKFSPQEESFTGKNYITRQESNNKLLDWLKNREQKTIIYHMSGH